VGALYQDSWVFAGSSVNHLGAGGEVGFENRTGADGLLTEVLTETGWGGPAPSIEEAGVTSITYSTALEVRS